MDPILLSINFVAFIIIFIVIFVSKNPTKRAIIRSTPDTIEKLTTLRAFMDAGIINEEELSVFAYSLQGDDQSEQDRPETQTTNHQLCGTCGTQLQDYMQFCPECGTPRISQ